MKELVITGGFNVSPSEVEDALRGFTGVADIAIVGIPSARDGEHVVAAVVAAAGQTVDPSSTARLRPREPRRRTRCPSTSTSSTSCRSR